MAYVEPRQPTSSPDTPNETASALVPGSGRPPQPPLASRPRACRAAGRLPRHEQGQGLLAIMDQAAHRGMTPGAEQRDPEQHVGDQMADDVDDEVGAHHRIGAEPVQQTGVGTAVGQLRHGAGEVIQSGQGRERQPTHHGQQPTDRGQPGRAGVGELRQADGADGKQKRGQDERSQVGRFQAELAWITLVWSSDRSAS